MPIPFTNLIFVVNASYSGSLFVALKVSTKADLRGSPSSKGFSINPATEPSIEEDQSICRFHISDDF